LDFWAPSFSRPARASKHPPHRPWGYLRVERFHEARLWRAQREALPACLGKERETPRRFVARTINPLTAQPLLSLSPLTLLSQIAKRFLFHRRLHRRRRPCCLAASSHCSREGRASHRRGAHQPLPVTSTAACKMSVSTLNPHLVHSVSLHDVRRRALDDMHSRSARFRVEGQYCSAEVFSPFVVLMMCAAARVRVQSVRCR
jgi:hypothetical protein